MMKNLRLAFGDQKTETELLRIAEQSIQNLLKLSFEFIRTPEASANPERYIDPPDVSPLMEAVKKKAALSRSFPISEIGSGLRSPFKNSGCMCMPSAVLRRIPIFTVISGQCVRRQI
jgi:hypothetical protein